jgi:hypothetical protein
MAGSRRRLNGIEDRVWLDPYVIGFLSVLITQLAEEAGVRSVSGLGSVQIGTWTDLTGDRSIAIGDEICRLSLNFDREFLDGCGNALRFLSEMQQFGGVKGVNWPTATQVPGVSDEASWKAAESIWQAYFDVRIRDTRTLSVSC